MAFVPLPVNTVLAPTAQAQEVPHETAVATSTPAYPAYVLANCYAFVRYTIPSFPMASLVIPNTAPKIGAVVIFNYDGLPHYGIISSFDANGFNLTDSNYGGPGIRTHYVTWDNKYIVGFWSTSTE